MKTKTLLLLAVLTLLVTDAMGQQIGSSVYVGGHIRRQRPSTITKLKESGFNNVILFNVNVEENGDLTTDVGGEAGGTICKNGKYVFNTVQPYYVQDVKNLKIEPTGIVRIEICIGGWGNQSYNRIKSLINSQGTGENSILYKNFKALKDAIPEIDAVNNDDEHCYDVSSAVKFHTMMYDLGYKTSLAPYMNKNFWESLATQLNQARPGACDIIMIQCYDGGAGNNPRDWHIGNIPLHAGRTNYQSSMDESINQMKTWRDQANVTGGFVWLYNDESWNLNNWAINMNKTFHSLAPETEVVRLYRGKNYSTTGDSLSLGEGRFTKPALAARGAVSYFALSARIKPGYKLTVYKLGDLTYTNTSLPTVYTKDTTTITRGQSLIVETNGTTGLSGKYRLKGSSGLYWQASTRLQQQAGSEETTQVFNLKELSEEGIYAIYNESTRLYLSYNPSRRSFFFTNEDSDDPMQQWIVYDSGEGNYQIIARTKATVVENASAAAGSLRLAENTQKAGSFWLLESWPPTGIKDEGLRIKDENNNPSSHISHPSSVYDLQGRRLTDENAAQKTIIVKKGKKYIKK